MKLDDAMPDLTNVIAKNKSRLMQNEQIREAFDDDEESGRWTAVPQSAQHHRGSRDTTNHSFWTSPSYRPEGVVRWIQQQPKVKVLSVYLVLVNTLVAGEARSHRMDDDLWNLLPALCP